MARFFSDRPLNMMFATSTAPFQSYRAPICGPVRGTPLEAGDIGEIPDAIAFVFDRDMAKLGIPITWIEQPSVDELEEQEALAARFAAEGTPLAPVERGGLYRPPTT